MSLVIAYSTVASGVSRNAPGGRNLMEMDTHADGLVALLMGEIQSDDLVGRLRATILMTER